MTAVGEMMSRPTYIVLHALAAGVFVFLLQSFALGATSERSFMWAIAFGLAAAALAWHQSNR
jgi:hypothetical protein